MAYTVALLRADKFDTIYSTHELIYLSQAKSTLSLWPAWYALYLYILHQDYRDAFLIFLRGLPYLAERRLSS